MKLWVDDVRPAPEGYVWCFTVRGAIDGIKEAEFYNETIELIDIDHDAGVHADNGGDYIRILDWLEETGRNPR